MRNKKSEPEAMRASGSKGQNNAQLKALLDLDSNTKDTVTQECNTFSGTFQIDVSRSYRNKVGYEVGGYRLNMSFQTETHTPDTFLRDVVSQGWPYTMVYAKRSPKHTGAAKRGVTTPKHTENFISRQELTLDDDSQAAGVIDYWLSDKWFSRYGFAFVESKNSQPGAEKGHPTIIFDRPITDPALYKEAMKAAKHAWPRLDPLNNIDRTIYNAENARIHKIGHICPWPVFERDILEPYRRQQQAQAEQAEQERRERQAEYEQAKRNGTTVKPDEKYITATVSGIVNFLAMRTEGRHTALFWAGVKIGALRAACWTLPYRHVLDVEQDIIQATRQNGYYDKYAKRDTEVLRTFAQGATLGATSPAGEPELYYKDGSVQDVAQRSLRPYTLSKEAQARRDTIKAKYIKAQRLQFSQDVPAPEHDTCPHGEEGTGWSFEQGTIKTYFYCNKSNCDLCRRRMVVKLGYYLTEIAQAAYIGKDGNAAYLRPLRTDTGEIMGRVEGTGQWYAKILTDDSRRAWRKRYKTARPEGFIQPEIYPIPEGYLALSLAPFEDMVPVKISDDILLQIVTGREGTRSSLLFAPPKKQLAGALPAFEVEVPHYLAERGIVEVSQAAHSLVFFGDVSDVYSSFDTHAQTFDDIRLVLEEIGEKTISRQGLFDDTFEWYAIRYSCILPGAKGIWLDLFNAGREGDKRTLDLYRRKDLPNVPTASDKRVDKDIGLSLELMYMPLSTRQADKDGEPGPEYYARLEQQLRWER